MNIDISQYQLLTPAGSNLNPDSPITLYHKNGDIIKKDSGCTDKINLNDYRGVETKEFYLTFQSRDNEYIKKCQNSESCLHALYYVFNFGLDDGWVECYQHNELEFMDAMFYDDDEIQPSIEKSTIVGGSSELIV